MRNYLYNEGYIRSHNPKTYDYGILFFCEIKGHAHNFGGFYFESLEYLRWKKEELKGLSFLKIF